MTSPKPTDTRLAEEAAEWLIRLAEESCESTKTEFVAWLKRSPRHVEEFLLVSTAQQLVSDRDANRDIDLAALLAETHMDVAEFPSQARAREAAMGPAVSRRSRVTRLAMAAAVAMLFLGGLFWLTGHHATRTYATGVGEQRALHLEDGSLLHLNTRSRVSVAYSDHAREVRLLAGEALFNVEGDPKRPFRVLTPHAVVQAVGTQFNVYERSEATRVAVVQGRVKIIEKGSPPVLLGAGEEAVVRANGAIARASRPDIDTAVAWRQRRLSFHGATLAEVVSEFNRYNQRQIELEGPNTPGRRITAVFNADDPEALLRFLEHEPNVELQRRRGSAVIRVKVEE